MPSIEQLTKLLSADPADTFVLYALAQEHAKAGDHDQAIDLYRRCIAEDEAYCYAYFHGARSLEALDRATEAAEMLETGLAVAERVGDAKASSEIAQYRGSLDPGTG
ncbi:MAG: hypothetical protein AAGF47_01630 [Planctomycetota bacterium]